MAPTDTTGRITFWKDHVTTWQASDLTQKAYCETHGLRYATFGYWVRKLRAPSVDRENTSGFVPVALSRAGTSNSSRCPSAHLSVSLSNGFSPSTHSLSRRILCALGVPRGDFPLTPYEGPIPLRYRPVYDTPPVSRCPDGSRPRG